MRNLFKLIKSFILGLFAGSLLGILFAPDSGEKTREKLTTKSKQALNEASEQKQLALEEAKRQVSELQTEIKRIGEELEKN